MADFFGKLVVRAHAPKRRAVLLGSAALLAALILYAAFRAGPLRRGISRGRLGARRIGGEQRASATLEAENARQRTQLEAADVARRVDREGYKQVERSLGDMQSQIARLNQDLSFYRGLVQPDSLVHVKVQQMQIVPDAAGPGGAAQYRLKFVLMQTGKPDNVVSGSASISVDGLQDGKPVSLSFAELSPSRRVSLAYSFRYFEDYDEAIQLPQGFEPTRVGVEIHSGNDTSHGLRQAFVWKAQGMSVETEANGDHAQG